MFNFRLPNLFNIPGSEADGVLFLLIQVNATDSSKYVHGIGVAELNMYLTVSLYLYLGSPPHRLKGL